MDHQMTKEEKQFYGAIAFLVVFGLYMLGVGVYLAVTYA